MIVGRFDIARRPFIPDLSLSINSPPSAKGIIHVSATNLEAPLVAIAPQPQVKGLIPRGTFI